MEDQVLLKKLESWITRRHNRIYDIAGLDFDCAEPSIRKFLHHLTMMNELIVKKYPDTDVAYFHLIIEDHFTYWGNRMMEEGKTDILEKYPDGPDGLPEPAYPDPLKSLR